MTGITVMDDLLLGLTLGFAAGISPGPLLTLVMTATLERGFGAGLRVAVAPALTDAPIVAIALFVLKDFPPLLLEGISVAGGLLVIFIGLSTLWTARGKLETGTGPATDPRGRSTDLWRGMLVNLLNPQPWIFWATVGGPILLRSWATNPAHAVGFLSFFYLLLIGSKIVAAALVAQGRDLLQGTWYRLALTGSGFLLIALGGLLAWRGLAGPAG